MTDNIKQLYLRLPAKLHAWLVKLAKDEYRSLNNTIVSILAAEKARQEERDRK